MNVAKINNTTLFVILCLLTFIASEATKYIFDLNTLIYNSLIEKLSIEKADEIFNNARKWQLLGYVFIPLFLFLKTQLIAGILGMGSMFYSKVLPHKKLWGIVLKAEFIFILLAFIKIAWLFFSGTDFDIDTIENFQPLSVLSLIGYESVDLWYRYPLKVINLFEILYCIVLAFLIDRLLKEKNKNSGILIVTSSYAPTLLLWIAGVMFLTLNLN
mgnify:FL=1